MTKAIATLALCSCTFVAFAGTEVSHARFRDESALIDYRWTENCVTTTLTVTAAKTKVKADGSIDTGTSLTLTYGTRNFCDFSNVIEDTWYKVSDTAALQIDSNLRSARLITPAVALRGTRTISGQTGSVTTDLGTIMVSVDLAWTSDDPIDKYAGTIVIQHPGYQEVSHLTGFYRLASAAGVISDGTSNWFPAQPQGLVQMFRLSKGETILTRE